MVFRPEDGRDLRDGIAPTGEQDHSDALTHSPHLASGQSFQLLPLLFLERSDENHRPCSLPAVAAYVSSPKTAKDYWNLTMITLGADAAAAELDATAVPNRVR